MNLPAVYSILIFVRRYITSGLTGCAFLFGLTMNNKVLAETSSYVDVPICKNGMAYSIPARPGLRVNSKYISTDERDRPNKYRMVWKPKDQTIFADRLTFNESPGYVKNLPPILDVILDRSVPYAISQLRIGALFQGTPEDWIGETKPSDIEGLLETPGHGVSGREKYVTRNLTVFGSPVHIWCSPAGLPVYSKDENSRSCIIHMLAPGPTMMSVRIHTGYDLPGHWPSFDEASTAWAEPLKFVEQAMNEIMVTSEEGAWECN